MKKILISVCGIGLGHATRCQPIIEELLKHPNEAEIKVISYGSGHKYLKEAGIPCEETTGYEYKGSQFTFSVLFNILDSFRNPTKLRKDYFDFLNVVGKFKPDMVFSDTDPNAFFYAYRRSIPNFVLTNLITVLNNFSIFPKKYLSRDILVQQFMIDRLINFMKSRTERFYVPTFEQKLRYIENVMYTDVIIRKKPSELPSTEELRRKLGIDKDFYYVSVGGAEIEKYLYYLIENILPEFKDKYFVVSSNGVIKKTIEKENMKVFPFIKNALEYLKASQGIIAPSGYSSLSEALCYKKPMLAIPVRNHIEQIINAAMLSKEGFGTACYLEKKKVPETLSACMKKFFAEQEHMKSKLDASNVNGNGAKQIAEDILSY